MWTQVVSELSLYTSTLIHGGRKGVHFPSSSVTQLRHLIKVMSSCCTSYDSFPSGIKRLSQGGRLVQVITYIGLVCVFKHLHRREDAIGKNSSQSLGCSIFSERCNVLHAGEEVVFVV